MHGRKNRVSGRSPMNCESWKSRWGTPTLSDTTEHLRKVSLFCCWFSWLLVPWLCQGAEWLCCSLSIQTNKKEGEKNKKSGEMEVMLIKFYILWIILLHVSVFARACFFRGLICSAYQGILFFIFFKIMVLQKMFSLSSLCSCQCLCGVTNFHFHFFKLYI